MVTVRVSLGIGIGLGLAPYRDGGNAPEHVVWSGVTDEDSSTLPTVVHCAVVAVVPSVVVGLGSGLAYA
jgi:hypothetical protein